MRIAILIVTIILLFASSVFSTHTYNADSTILTITELSDSVTQSMHRGGSHANDYITIKPADGVIRGTSQTGGTIGGIPYYYIFKFSGTCHHWILDLSGNDGIPRTSDDDTIYFGDDRNNNMIGVFITSPGYNIKFRGGVWYHDPTGLTGNETSLPANYTDYYAIMGVRGGDACYNFYFDSVTIRTIASWTTADHSWGNWTVRCGGAGHNYFFNNAKLISRQLAYPDRQDGPGRAISFAKFAGDDLYWADPESCHVKITGGQIESSSKGLYTEESSWGHYDSARIQVYKCSIKTDAVELYETGEFATTTNSYGIHGRYWGKGSFIRKCYFSVGTQYQGGRSIMLEHWVGRPNSPVYIDSNRFDRIHDGVDRTYNTVSTSMAIKVRQPGRDTITVPGYLRIEYNSISVLADTCTYESYGTGYSPRAAAITYEWWDTTNSHARMYFDSIQNNVCSVYVNPANSNPLSSYPWKMHEIGVVGVYWQDTTTAFKNNTIYTEQYGILVGGYDGPAKKNTFIQANTIKIDTIIHPNLFTSSTIGSWAYDANNSFDFKPLDNIFQGAAQDTQVRFRLGNGMSARLQRTIRVYVKGSNNRPVLNATVTVKNAYNQTVLTGTTGSNGLVSGIVTYHMDSSETGDSTGFNPFSFKAKKGIDSTTNSPFTVGDTDAEAYDTISLAATVGYGMWEGGDDIAEWTFLMDTARNRDYFLNGPKSQIVPLRTRKSFVVFKGFYTIASDANWYRVNYTDSTCPSSHKQLASGDSISMNSARNADRETEPGLAKGDTIFWTSNEPSVYTNTVHINRLATTGTSLIWVDSQNISIPFSNMNPIALAARRRGDSLFILARTSYTGGSPPAMDSTFQYLTSNDNGGTWTYRNRLTTTILSGSDVRADADEFHDSLIWCFAVRAASAGSNLMKTWVYNGSSAVLDNVVPPTSNTHRELGAVITSDSVQHLILPDTGLGTSNPYCIVHMYKKFGSGSWSVDTIYIADRNSRPWATASFTRASNTIRAYYTKTDSSLVTRKWLGSSWSSEVLVNSGKCVGNLVAADISDTIHGDRAFVGYRILNGSVWNNAVTVIRGSGVTIAAPAEVDSTPTTISSVQVDSIRSDFFGEQDSCSYRVTTGSGNGDSVYVAWSITGIPNRNASNMAVYEFIADHAFQDTMNPTTTNGSETYTLYVSSWVKYGPYWSDSTVGTKTLTLHTPPATDPPHKRRGHTFGRGQTVHK